MAKRAPTKAKKLKPSNSLQQDTERAPLEKENRSASSSNRNGSTSPRQDNMNGNGSHTTVNATVANRQVTKHENGSAALPKNKATTPTISRTTRARSPVGIILRTLLLDIPLLLIFITYVSMVVLHHVYDEYLMPQAELMQWTQDRKTPEITYYDRTCSVEDISTNTTDDLLISSNHTPTDCMHHMAKHGVSLYPNILQSDTADTLREWIVQRNQVEEGWYVISGNHRYTFGIGVNQDPIVTKALSEIANHPVFRPAIQEICGPNPAVIEFTAITSEYGAEDQFWHQDTLPLGSSFKHARTFVPSYSLFIPLQDTSAELGATEICPGSHVCNGVEEFCVEGGFRALNKEGVWPKSTGALVNQHLFHRGMAHTDPNGLDRVLFILTFAPRPRFGIGEVETRLLSMGGSYSLHWRQWGHTLNDFGNAAVAMKEPWKTIRSLGLYKSPDSDWGWDMPSVASMRIMNDDNGYHDGDLEDWLEEKGGFAFVPKQLQAEYDEETGWVGFLQTTMVNCEKASEKVYFLASGIYLIFLLSLTLLQRLSGTKSTSGGSPFGRAILRIIVTHAAAVALACLAVYTIADTPWAQNIRQGRQYTQSVAIEDGDTFPIDMLPGTLPYKRDVLAETKYSSEYLYGTNYVIDNAHPGNVDYNKIIAANSVGYRDLSPMLQTLLTATVMDWVGQDMGRFLTQNEEGNWAAMPDAQAQKTIHKDLVKASNGIVAHILTKLAYLLSETKFGVLRDTAMHRRHIQVLSTNLQDKMLNPPSFEPNKNNTVVHLPLPLSQRKPSLASPRSSVAIAPTLVEKASASEKRSLSSLPPVFMVDEPYPGAWAAEGDVIEARYNGVYNEWYRGVIVDLDQDSGTYDVQYDDGEVDEDLCRMCIRPYVSLQVNEDVEVREEDSNTYYSGRVVQVHADGTVDIDAGENGLFDHVDVAFTRRVDPVAEGELGVGSRVEARYARKKKWYGAVVTRIRGNGSFDLLYDDGDVEYKVERKYIRVL